MVSGRLFRDGPGIVAWTHVLFEPKSVGEGVWSSGSEASYLGGEEVEDEPVSLSVDGAR